MDHVDAVEQVGAVLHAQFRLLAHDYAADREVVVRPLCAVHNRSLLDCDAAFVSFHIVVGPYYPRFHVEVEGNHVTLLPPAVDSEVALLKFSLDFLAVHEHLVAELLAVLVAVEVARNDFAPYPTRDSELEREILRVVLLDADLDVTVPRI